MYGKQHSEACDEVVHLRTPLMRHIADRGDPIQESGNFGPRGYHRFRQNIVSRS